MPFAMPVTLFEMSEMLVLRNVLIFGVNIGSRVGGVISLLITCCLRMTSSDHSLNYIMWPTCNVGSWLSNV